ncbi:MAG: hypothetical protein KDD15_26645, partial [Lewinella sp.]|nr:hypothetical protein [Lewinella sp.]
MLRKDLKTLIYFFVQITAAWTFAWIIFYFLRQYGIEEYPYVTFSRLPDWSAQLATHIGVGLLSGLLYGITELVFERPYFQRHSYGRLILIKTLIYFIIAVVLMSAAVLILQRVLFGVILWAKVSTWLVSANFLVALFYFLCISILISLFRQMNYKFGPEVLRNMLIGKYHRPREEMRIFMFLDLQASTTIAEQLGHIRFSRLLQDCFFDLTEPVLRHRAEIYQYVGDEAVLCWPVKGGFKNNHCLHCYFDFLDRLEERADYYQAKYGLLPFFKAGVHYG